MQKIKFLGLAAAFIALAVLTSCKKQKPDDIDPVEPQKVVFVINEGPFQNGTGSISLFYPDSAKVYNNVFQTVSGFPLGNIVQSMTIIDKSAYIVVNNANKIQVCDLSMNSITSIDDLTLPRYMIEVNATTAYVSCWDKSIQVIDLKKNESVKSIAVGTGPEKMLKYNNKVFVLNQGGFGIDSAISVIDITTHTLIHTIDVSLRPGGIVLDKNDKLWVMCSGQVWPTQTKAHLTRINPDTYEIETNIEFNSMSEHPDKLIINETGDILYYATLDGIFSFSIESTQLPTEPLIVSNSVYGLAYDAEAKQLYYSDPIDYAQNGMVYRYQSNGTLIDSFEAGIVPGNFYFANIETAVE